MSLDRVLHGKDHGTAQVVTLWEMQVTGVWLTGNMSPKSLVLVTAHPVRTAYAMLDSAVVDGQEAGTLAAADLALLAPVASPGNREPGEEG